METNLDKIKIKLAIRNNNFDKAAQIVYDAFKDSKSNFNISDAYIILGNFFASRENYENSGILTKLLNLKPSTESAILCYHIALQHSNPFAVKKLEQYYFYSKDGKEKNITAMMAIYELGARLNDAYSEYKLGKLYFEGVYCVKDYEKALKHFKKSYILNPDYSSYYLGQMYEKGLGVKKDLKKAFDYYLDGASESAKSKFRLAKIYSSKTLAKAFGTKQNLAVSERYYKEYCEFLENKNEYEYENKEEKIRYCSKFVKNIKKERLEKLKPIMKEVKEENKQQKEQVFDFSLIPQR